MNDEVRTSTGGTRSIVDVRPRLTTSAVVYNLAVDDIHTYYAGDTPVLVHNSCGGESAAAAYGRLRHAEWDYGPDFVKEFNRIPGIRPDAVNFVTREVVELKPNTAGQIRRGMRQLDVYQGALQRAFPGRPWTTRLETYEPYAP